MNPLNLTSENLYGDYYRHTYKVYNNHLLDINNYKRGVSVNL
jgi:hypothetical protein